MKPALAFFFGALAALPVAAEAADAAAPEFTLSCVPCAEGIGCSLRNASTNEIRYSSYTIGYHEAVLVEYCDPRTGRWQPCPLKSDLRRPVRSVGAGAGDLKSAAPGAVVPPERGGMLKLSCPGEFTFVVRPEDYAFPQGERLAIRITQLMGTMLGSDLPVWKGRVVSAPIEIEFDRNTATVIRKHETGLGIDPPPAPPPPIPAHQRAFVRDYAVTGATIRAGFVPAKMQVVWGEPLEVEFTVENFGPGDFEFLFGGDYRGTGRNDRFKIEVTDAAGKLLPDPHANAPDFGGMMSRELLTLGGKAFSRVLDLTQFCTFERPGEYIVRCRFDLAEPGAGKPATGLPVVKAEYHLAILERTPERVAQVLDELAAAVAAAPEADLAVLTKRMARFGHEDAVPRLAQVAKSGPVARRVAAIAALPLIPGDGSLDVALSGLKDADPAIRCAAAAAVGELQMPRGVEALLRALDEEPAVAAARGRTNNDRIIDDRTIPSAPLPNDSVANGSVISGPLPVVREAVLRALGASKSARALPVLADTLRHGTPALQQAAIDGLVANGGPEAVAALTNFAVSDDLDLRYRVVLALAERLQVPIKTEWLQPILMCRGEDHGGWLDTLRLFRLYGGERAVPALLSGLDFDAAWSGRNWWILNEVQACPNAPKFAYEHDPNSNGTPEACAKNARTLAELKKLAGPIAPRPAWPTKEPPPYLQADPPIDFKPVFKPLENGAEIQSGFFRTAKHRGGGNWNYTPSAAYEPMYKTAEAARELIRHPERYEAMGIGVEQAEKLYRLPLPSEYPNDDSAPFLFAWLEAPASLKERAQEKLSDAIRLVSQRRHAEIVAFVEAVKGILTSEQLAKLSSARANGKEHP